jgi:hypothetical protein
MPQGIITYGSTVLIQRASRRFDVFYARWPCGKNLTWRTAPLQNVRSADLVPRGGGRTQSRSTCSADNSEQDLASIPTATTRRVKIPAYAERMNRRDTAGARDDTGGLTLMPIAAPRRRSAAAAQRAAQGRRKEKHGPRGDRAFLTETCTHFGTLR